MTKKEYYEEIVRQGGYCQNLFCRNGCPFATAELEMCELYKKDREDIILMTAKKALKKMKILEALRDD